MDTRSRRPLVKTVVRTLVVSACLLVLYAFAPLDRRFGPGTVAALVAALVALGALVWWQAQAIVRSASPRLRAVEALATSVVLFLVLFAAAYRLMDNGAPGSFNEPLTRVDALYFAVTVFSSVGFGDIAPASRAARILTMAQMLADLVLLGVAVKVLLEAVRHGLERQDGQGRP
ncbi:potassium channel family protein [Actinomadura opuntiae]|uniref:potassium channel family protein n=1 Tax=Actinomadura sp. OS1-43 TaxID=604315 RepID=UPI00255ADB9E|nr:potassium channel family protein [Actinomadura sp. OS1-43]MDL4815339.1 potassium channel family protein [Actinomadura sp. OS1-43]